MRFLQKTLCVSAAVKDTDDVYHVFFVVDKVVNDISVHWQFVQSFSVPWFPQDGGITRRKRRKICDGVADSSNLMFSSAYFLEMKGNIGIGVSQIRKSRGGILYLILLAH